MPRRKASTTANNSTRTAPLNPHKRQLSSSSTTPVATTTSPANRQSKRIKASAENTPTTCGKKATPKKSKYFEGPSSDNEDDDEDQKGASPEVTEEETSGYEDEDASATLPSSPSPSEEDASESDGPRTGRAHKKKQQVKKRPAEKSSTTNAQSTVSGIIEKGKELWRQGVKVGLGPGKEVFIERPKPRGDGGIKYVPDRIHPNTMAFLADLRDNNEREWMKNDTIPELPPKDLVFRVYRDIRFSPDPTPYKPYFSAAWSVFGLKNSHYAETLLKLFYNRSRTGRKGPYAGYYVQIAPGGKSFVGCGLWMPEAAPLALVRRDIDRSANKLKRILMEPGIRKEVLGGVSKDETKAVKAFVSQNQENALKTKPKGYEADNPNIELLRLKNFTIGRKLQDDEVVGPGGLDRIASLVGTMTPFVTYLNSVIMPDEEDEASTDEASEASEAEEPE
ncbi:hypothetical protein EPUS_04901 [Endocarpon pusillum Z07020]|uniref:Uncharacterized protein n=1 Tax=Endocarpon pusillum (strain Z07020 / HMAS-L-300199) TaxID=1263415 RepID=U1GB23_ENDPU|nr:uncharacterized protein EPUS_04901 [Endocarpon pusillum Z07020]ERF74732.1 hypothetical protein EPUS_04901 [Endocarpon pusillum Z07020]